MKRCDSCTHSQEDDYSESLITINKNVKNPRHPKT
jgi:hypothetical protein